MDLFEGLRELDLEVIGGDVDVAEATRVIPSPALRQLSHPRLALQLHYILPYNRLQGALAQPINTHTYFYTPPIQKTIPQTSLTLQFILVQKRRQCYIAGVAVGSRVSSRV